MDLDVRAGGAFPGTGRPCLYVPVISRAVQGGPRYPFRMSSNVDVHNREVSTAMAVLGALSFCHLLNDMMQSLLPAIYPILKTGLHLDFGQIGLITFIYQVTASLLQPVIGLYTDRRPKPYSLAVGMGFTLTGLLLLSVARRRSRCCCSRPRLVGLGLVGVPSRVVARRAHGIGRTARLRAVGVPGRRQRRLGARSAARGVHRAAARAGRASPGSRWRRCSASRCSRGRRLVRAPGRAARGHAPACAARVGAVAAREGRRLRSRC